MSHALPVTSGTTAGVPATSVTANDARLVDGVQDALIAKDVSRSEAARRMLVGDPRPLGRSSIFMLFDVSTLNAAAAMVDELPRGDVASTAS